MKKINKLLIFSLLSSIFLLSSCSKERSSTTGWAYNDSNNGGFEKPYYFEQETGPGLVLIEGGRFTMGRTEQDIFYDLIVLSVLGSVLFIGFLVVFTAPIRISGEGGSGISHDCESDNLILFTFTLNDNITGTVTVDLLGKIKLRKSNFKFSLN